MLTTSLERHDGRLAIVRRADGDDAEPIREEMAALTAMADLPVPRVLAWIDEQSRVEAITSYSPAVRDLTLAQLATAVDVLACAHDRHIAHGAFTAGSVRIDGNGAVTVDGWMGIARKIDDVAAVGAALDQLLETPGVGGPRRLALTGLAARAGAGDPTTRPGMAALAHGIKLGDESVPMRSDHRRSDQPANPTMRAAPPALVLGGAFALLAGVIGIVADPKASSTPSPTPAESVSAAPVVLIGSERARVGAPGDLGVAGRWNCSSSTTPGLLRADGSVWLWVDLAGAPERVGRVNGGATVERGLDADGCDVPVVRDESGTRLTIRP